MDQVHENGDIHTLSKIQVDSEPTVHKISPHSIILRTQGKIHQYDINNKLKGFEKEYYWYEVNERSIVGWKNVKSELHQTWNF